MPWQPARLDRRKSLAMVALVHAGLGAALVLGLATDSRRVAERTIATFDVAFPPPEADPPPPPAPEAAAKEPAGPPDLAARPAPVVVPPPAVRLPVSPSIPAAREAAPDTGAAPDAGAASEAGTGRGAGGAGDGTGGGGSGGAGGGRAIGSEARLLSGNLTRGDYRRIRSFGALRGQAVLAIEIGADGRLSRCMALASSGNGALDAELCRLLTRTRWSPARDTGGVPIPVSLRYVATWNRD